MKIIINSSDGFHKNPSPKNIYPFSGKGLFCLPLPRRSNFRETTLRESDIIFHKNQIKALRIIGKDFFLKVT